jgi:thiol-disulfide isomerase/thioredoxin
MDSLLLRVQGFRPHALESPLKLIMKIAKLSSLIFALLFSVASADARTWTEAGSGRTVEGEFRKLNGDTVEVLRPNGTLLKLPLAKLSESDRKFVSEQSAGTNAESAEAERPVVTHKEGSELQEGDVIDLVGRPVNGEKVDLAAMPGKVVLLDFWATWCGPCIAELPNVKAAYEKYHDKGFEIVGISLDSDEKRLEDFIEENDMPWPQLCDGKGWDSKLAKHYGIRGIPAVFLVKDNKIVATGVRGSRLEEKLEELLK